MEAENGSFEQSQQSKSNTDDNTSAADNKVSGKKSKSKFLDRDMSHWRGFGFTGVKRINDDELTGKLPDGVIALYAEGKNQVEAQQKELQAIGIPPTVMGKVKEDANLILYALDGSVTLQEAKDSLDSAMQVYGPGDTIPLPAGKYFEAEQIAKCVQDLSVLDHLDRYVTSSDEPPVKGETPKKSIAQNRPLSSTQTLPIKPWKPLRIDAAMFPDNHNGKAPTTVNNIAFLLEKNGIGVRYNVIKKKTEITFPKVPMTAENCDNVAMTHIISLAALSGLSTGTVPQYVEAIGDRNAHNPVKDWITSKPWDGIDRLPDFYNTIEARDEYPISLKEVLMRK